MKRYRALVAMSIAQLALAATCLVPSRVSGASKTTENEEAVLTALEERSKAVRSIDCEFTQWDYWHTTCRSVSLGKLSRRTNGAWEVQVNDFQELDHTSGELKPAAHGREHWIFDGDHYWELKATEKQIRQYSKDASVFGYSVEGMFSPIWLALGTGKAKEIQRSYDVRVITDPRFAESEIWIEFVPRSQAMRDIYTQVVAIYKRPDMFPHAIRIAAPNGSDYRTFEFRKLKVNDIFAPEIVAPKPPAGWEVVHSGVPAAAKPAPSRQEAGVPASGAGAHSPQSDGSKPRRGAWRGLFRRSR